MNKGKIIIVMLVCFSLLGCRSAPSYNVPKEYKDIETTNVKEGKYRSIAYVTAPASKNWRWIGTDDVEVVSNVDTRYVTHINFAFGMIDTYQFDPNKEGRPLADGEVVSKEAYKDPVDNQYHYRVTVDGWIEEMSKEVEGSKYLRALVKLKEQKPDLKVLLSIGGWDSDGFCYMAQTKEGRAEFIDSCKEIIDSYQLDGIDIDWEYPNNGGYGTIASCDTCIEDASKLLVEFRESLDKTYPKHKLLTIASGIPWVDEDTFKALDYMNVMCYDQAPGSGRSQASFSYTKNKMQEHTKMVGDSFENRTKINLGIPFYNEGGPHLVPYHQGWDGYVDASPEITKEKMDWVKENDYGGGFYWAYSMDTFEQDVSDPIDPEVKILQRTVYETLNGKVK